MGDLTKAFAEFNAIIGICPCCGDISRLSEMRPYLKGAKPSSEFDLLDAEERRLDRIEEALEEQVERLREKARELGRKEAARRLKAADPCFAGCGIDPQDVKVLFDPVEYIVFDGMAKKALRKIWFVGEQPAGKADERLQTSLQDAVRKGNLEFITLRVTNDGKVEKE